MNKLSCSTDSERGFSMIEILVTIVILAIGLLGLAGLQAKALTAQMESYQRQQALILVKDMADRIEANRKNAASYIKEFLPEKTCPDSVTQPDAAATVIEKDLYEWCRAMLGGAEEDAKGNKVGAMVGAYGCITQVSAGGAGVPAQYLVSVAWQGLEATASPDNTCGTGRYGSNEALRRVIALPVTIANLN